MTNDDSPTQPVPPRLTPEEAALYTWGQEMRKNQWQFLNSCIQQLVTLTAVLFGGSVALLNTTVMSPPFAKWAVGLFLGATIVAVLGLIPVDRTLDLKDPTALKSAHDAGMNRRTTIIHFSVLLFVLGLVVTCAGVMCR